MFAYAPQVPKDYILKEVPPTQTSAQVHTPFAPPRITQTNVAKYCFPVEAADHDSSGETKPETIRPRILDKWANEWRAYWVDKPGYNAYFLHDMQKKFTVVSDSIYDPRYQHKPKIFNRPYQYEMECLEEERLHKLRRKCVRDAHSEKTAGSTNNSLVDQKLSGDLATKSTYRQEDTSLRWRPEPDLLATSIKDPCIKRREMALVGQPFKHEAVNWYYKNYPPPKFAYRRQKL